MNDPRYPYMTYDEIIAAEKREQAQTEAYADGRADERAEWVPVLEALRVALRQLEALGGKRRKHPEEGQDAIHAEVLEQIDTAIEKAGG
jgi:predicted nucleic acid-binding protein